MQNQLTPSQPSLQQPSSNLQQNSSNLQPSSGPSGLTNTTALPNQLPSTNRLTVQASETTQDTPSQTYLPQSSAADWIWGILFVPFIIAIVIVAFRRPVEVKPVVEEVTPPPVVTSKEKPKKPKQAKKTTKRQRSKK